MIEELPIWRIVLSGEASLQELETFYDFDDVLRLNAVLSYKEEIEEQRRRDLEQSRSS